VQDQQVDDPDASAYAVVAHGVLTSASVIVGLAETLGQRWADLDEAKRIDLVRIMGEQARTIHAVLQSLATALPPEVLAPLREAMALQIEPQAVERDTAARSAPATDASPNTSIASGD